MARYVIDRRIGEGGMAEVFRAQAEGGAGFRRVCAVKRLLPDLARDPGLQKRFIDEARIAGALRHPCVIAVVDFYEEAGVQHLVMEYVDGASLEHLCLRGRGGRFLPTRLTARLAHELARALEYAHAQGVLHRDVSCCNVLVSREGEVKLADFGLADARERVSSTEPGAVAGKAPYLSPERRRGEDATPADDLFALGVVLERLLQAGDPRERAGATGTRLRELAGRLTAPRAERVPSASALLAQLRTVERAGEEELAEHVRSNPQPRGPLPAAPRLAPDELDDTTDSGPDRGATDPGLCDETTVADGRPKGTLTAAAVALAALALLLAWLASRLV